MKEKVKEVFSFYTDDDSLIAKIEWFKADITDVPSMIPAFVGITKVYHCAAFISFNPRDYREMRKVNIHGTAIITNLSIDAKIDKICFVGSIASIGKSLDGTLITEECEWNSQEHNSDYSITKFGAEIEIWRASQEGVDVVIVNPGIILGSGFWEKGSSKLFTQVSKGLKYFTEGITGFVGVKDVVNSMILLMNSEVKNERFIVVSQNKSFKEILFSIADGLEKRRPSYKVSPWQTSLFWRISKMVSLFTKKAPTMSKYAARSAHGVSKYSAEKISNILDFKFTKISEVINDACKKFTA